jgi:hypothetical protein
MEQSAYPSERFLIRGEPKTRRLIVEGLEGASIAAAAPTPLQVQRGADTATIDMKRVEPGRTVELKLIWEAKADVRISDPTVERALIEPLGHCARARATLSVNRLHGYRLFAANASHVSFELSELNEGHIVGFSRVVDGDAPLVGYADDIRDLLGSTGSLDAQVRLSWLGGSDRAAEVRWYDIDPGSYVSSHAGPFSTSKLSMLGIEEVQACSLTDPRRTEAFVGKSFEVDSIGNLTNSLGPGPWLVFGLTRNGQVLRPRVVSEAKSSVKPAQTQTELRNVVRIADPSIREEQLLLKLKDTEGLQVEDHRLIIDTAIAARENALPMSTFDLLRAVSQAGPAVVWMLAMCESLDERSAVLNLQREFPFLWCVTSVNDWVDGFTHRVAIVAAKLTTVGIDPGEATRMTAIALGEIADLAPSLTAHVRAVFLALASSKNGAKQPTLDSGLVARLCRGSHVSGIQDGFRLAAGDLVRRTIDRSNPTNRLELRRLLGDRRGPWNQFDESFADLIAAPHVAALCAASRLAPTPGIVRRCREAWLFDPGYFESVAADPNSTLSRYKGK